MKLYTLTITANIDPDTLDVSLSADAVIAAPSLESVARSVMPAHLRKVANDIEAQGDDR